MTAADTPKPGVRRVRVLVADDQTVVRDGLEMILGLLPDVEVVGSARDGEEAVRLVGEQAPDVVLMDLRMPRCDGVEATRRIRAVSPSVQVIVLTTYADDESVFAALQAGAHGYLTKDADAAEIGRAVRLVQRGEALLDPAVQRRLLDAWARTANRPGVGATAGATTANTTAGRPPGTVSPVVGDPAVAASFPDQLTQREVEVLRWIAAGHSNQEIAAGLHVSEATVKTHVNHIFAKASLRDRAQAVAYAYQHDLLPPSGPTEV